MFNLFNRTPKAIENLSEKDFNELCSRCEICLILGGQKTCACISLIQFEEKTGLSISKLLKWYKKYSKNLKKRLDK